MAASNYEKIFSDSVLPFFYPPLFSFARENQENLKEKKLIKDGNSRFSSGFLGHFAVERPLYFPLIFFL